MSRSKTGRVGKRQKSAKTVRFENELCFTENESPSGRHPYRGGRPVQADEHSLHSRCEDLSTELNAEADGFTAGFDDIEMLEFEQEEQEPQRLDVDNNNKENKDPLRSGNACILEISADDRDKVALTQEELDGEHQSQYRALKISAWEWADTYFSVVTPAAEKSLDLLNLCTSSPELMEYANYISACTNDAWEYVFNGQRRFLVYCILGKMLDVHIFGHEMFGATEEQLKELRKMDGELVMEDGLFRQEERSYTLSTFLGGTPLEPAPSTTLPSNILHHLSTLQASFIHMLTPLFPSSPPQKELINHLTSILLSASILSLSIRRTPNTIYHFHTHPAVGSLFSSSSMHILDRDSAAEGNFWREATDVRVVTMAGWPSLVAYGPPINRHWKVGSGSDGTKSSDSTYMRVLGRAEVMVTWGPPVKPLKGQPCNWLGPCLRDEMSSRLEIKDREERAAIVGSGLAVGASLAMGWAFQQPWVIERVKELVGV